MSRVKKKKMNNRKLPCVMLTLVDPLDQN